MSTMHNGPPEIRRGVEILVGSVVTLGGLGLLGFAILVTYADLVRESPSALAVNLAIAFSSIVGIFCSLAGTRLLAGKKTRFDGLLLAPAAWKLIGILFMALAALLLLRGRVVPALASGLFGLLCYRYRGVLRSQSRSSGS